MAGKQGRVVDCDATVENGDGALMQGGGLGRQPTLREQDVPAPAAA